jgi:hypothetical protein
MYPIAPRPCAASKRTGCPNTLRTLRRRPPREAHLLRHLFRLGSASVCTKVRHCNGVSLTVTDNCHAALQNLRMRLGLYVIWVDALCINQRVNCDREQQIPFIGHIYANASTTYIWLGDGNSATDRVFDYFCTPGSYGTTSRTRRTQDMMP